LFLLEHLTSSVRSLFLENKTLSLLFYTVVLMVK